MKIRTATKADSIVVLELIKELAEYEKLAHEVVASKELIEEWIFEKQKAHVLLGYEEDTLVGYCLYFYNFSTFLARAGIYIEDIYVKEAYRNKGYGKQFFKAVAEIAIRENCGRIDWACLKWNQPSLEFYQKLGAEKQEEWVGLRLEGNQIQVMLDGMNK